MAINSANDNNMNEMAVVFQLQDTDDNLFPNGWNRNDDKCEDKGSFDSVNNY